MFFSVRSSPLTLLNTHQLSLGYRIKRESLLNRSSQNDPLLVFNGRWKKREGTGSAEMLISEFWQHFLLNDDLNKLESFLQTAASAGFYQRSGGRDAFRRTKNLQQSETSLLPCPRFPVQQFDVLWSVWWEGKWKWCWGQRHRGPVSVSGSCSLMSWKLNCALFSQRFPDT